MAAGGNGYPERAPPAFRRDGAYALLVFMHAQAVMRCGWTEGTAPDPERVAEAVARAGAALAGLERYWAHPYRRFAPEPPTLWRDGAVRVLDFGGTGPAVLVVPSMVNGPGIMDLSPDLSPLRWLARQDFRVLLVDWGRPGAAEQGFGIGAYLDARLVPALAAASRAAGANPVHLIGYCMGGPLALALAQRDPRRTGRIVTMAAPWHFDAFPEHGKLRERRAETVQMLAATSVMFGQVPPQMTQSFFALRDLAAGVRKFRRFAAIDPLSPEAKRFVAVEDWLNDGIPLAPKVAEECFLDWLSGDALRRGEWAPGGTVFHPSEVTSPALVVCAERDTVVRPAASEPLAEALPKAELLRVPVGHIGLVVGMNAIETVWRPVARFLRR